MSRYILSMYRRICVGFVTGFSKAVEKLQTGFLKSHENSSWLLKKPPAATYSYPLFSSHLKIWKKCTLPRRRQKRWLQFSCDFSKESCLRFPSGFLKLLITIASRLREILRNFKSTFTVNFNTLNFRNQKKAYETIPSRRLILLLATYMFTNFHRFP